MPSDEKMRFPYDDLHAYLDYSCSYRDGGSIAIIFSQNPNFQEVSESLYGFDFYKFRVKWDDKIVQHRLRHTAGRDFISFSVDEGNAPLEYLLKSKKALFEFDWYGEGYVYFEFSLSNASKSIQAAREICRDAKKN